MSGTGGSGGGDVPWPWALSLSVAPTTIKDLVGKKCRVVGKGDAVTQEYEPSRVTLFLDEEGRIVDVYFEPELPVI